MPARAADILHNRNERLRELALNSQAELCGPGRGVVVCQIGEGGGNMALPAEAPVVALVEGLEK